MYDYLIVGAGVFGATCANLLAKHGKSVLIIDKRTRICGNCADVRMDGITVHTHGAHIFHTNNKHVWDYVNSFGEFIQYQHNVKAYSGGKLYSLPFNMNTFYEMFGLQKADDVKAYLAKETSKIDKALITNLEEQAISLVGKEVYETLIKYYTEKQWGKSCTELDKSIIKRLPVRFTFDNNYFNDKYQGLPIEGYNSLVSNMLNHSKITTLCGVDFKMIDDWKSIAKKLIYSGSIDELFDYRFGELEWRSLKFETVKLNTDNFQGCPVVNYCDNSEKYTRIIEHKHFLREVSDVTYITYEYPKQYTHGDEKYYPCETNKNLELYNKYASLLDSNMFVGGRLGSYKYLNMDQSIAEAIDLVLQES